MSFKNLKSAALAIGSLPHTDVQKAMEIVRKDFFKIPFFPQLTNISKNEDMIIQFLEGLPSFSLSKTREFVLDIENEDFLYGLEEFFTDYEEIISDINSDKLEKYGLSKDFSSTFGEFEKIIRQTKPEYAKGQIVGPFTLATTLTDKNGRCAVYDETLRDVIVKLLSLKALWQIKHIKMSDSNTIPIIFMDEPSITQLGTSAYMTVSETEVVEMFKEIIDLIKANGGISAIHCCGKCDWRIPVKAGTDIINFDAYSYAKNFGTYAGEIKKFLEKGGMIAWGLVPTLDVKALEKTDLDDLEAGFNKSVNYLTKKGIDEKLVIDNSIITSSCGAGGLTEKLAEHAMDLVFELSERLKARL